jgi:4-hydroxybenzoate polyprenyltransferase
MFDINILLRLTRIKTFLPKLIFIPPLIFLISPQNLFSYKIIIVFLINVFLTASVYAINDVEDAEDDYHDLKKRKRNPISNGDLTKKQGRLIAFLLLFIGLSLLLTISYLVFLVGSALISVGIIYSWKPIRLKSKPIIDLISHAIACGGLQFSIAYLAFRSFDPLFISFLMVVIPISFASDISQQFRDFEVDRKTKINNTLQKFGESGPKKLMVVLAAIVMIGCVAISSTLNTSNLNTTGIFVLVLTCLGGIALLRCDKFFKLYRL